MIDSHAHIGIWGEWNCEPEALIERMDRHAAELAIVSDLAGNGIASAEQELSVNAAALQAIRPYAERLRLLYYLCPKVSPPDARVRALFREGGFAGFKLHPAMAETPLSDPAYERCFRLAEALRAPVCCHTEDDGFSNVRFLIEAAKRHPAARFVAVHSGFRTDHREAFRAAFELRNFYADTTLLHIPEVLLGIEIAGSENMLFGTDAPAIDEAACARYDGLYEAIDGRFGRNAAESVFTKNAERLFFR